MLTREDILNADDLKREKLDIPEWGGIVYVQTMTAKDRDRFEESRVNDKYKNIRGSLAVRVIVDENGKRLFADDDVEALGEKAAEPLSKVFNLAMTLNGMTEKDIEELEKNSDGDQNDSSGTN